MGNYRELLVWRKSMELAELIYHSTDTFPKRELYGLTSQMRRASISVPSNIAEGQGRGYDGQFIQFLGNARGSLLELETQTILAGRIGLLGEDERSRILKLTAEVARLLNGLSNSLR